VLCVDAVRHAIVEAVFHRSALACRQSGRSIGAARLLIALILGPACLVQKLDSSTAWVENSTGFCPEPVPKGIRWPAGESPAHLRFWASHCTDAQNRTARTESQQFPGTGLLYLYLAGFQGTLERRFIVRRLDTGQEFELRTQAAPADEWRIQGFSLPSDWIGKPVQLVAEARASGANGWLGFSEPLMPALSSLPAPVLTTQAPAGFCSDANSPFIRWPSGAKPPGIVSWISYCKCSRREIQAGQPHRHLSRAAI
jgi:hypothetical protein